MLIKKKKERKKRKTCPGPLVLTRKTCHIHQGLIDPQPSQLMENDSPGSDNLVKNSPTDM
jgi:hypothetical protein